MKAVRNSAKISSFALSGAKVPRTVILTVTNDLSYDQRMIRICSSLSRAGHNVLLVGRVRRNSAPTFEQPFKQHRINCFFERGKAFYAEFNLRLFFYLLFKKVDVICACDLDTLLAGYLVSIFRRKKLVYDAHEYFPEVPEVLVRPRIRKFWSSMERMLVPRVHHGYTVSEGLARIYQEGYGKSFNIIRNVPVLNGHRGKEPVLTGDPGLYLLYQGALNKGRGLEIVIHAMQEIPMPLYIVGEGDLSQVLRQMVKDLGLEQKVKFLGFVPPSELSRITNKAFAGINVSEKLGLSYYFSLNNKFFDYMHAGIPSITNDFPEYRRINEQNPVALLVKLDHKEIVDAVNRLIGNPQLYNQLRLNCLKMRQEENWENEEKKLLALYEGI